MDRLATLRKIIGQLERYTWLTVWLLLLGLFLLYLPTLQTDVNGSSHDYLLDTGEIQVALNTWGTVHYTGYPHYTILSVLVTQLGRGMGVGPAAAASLSSLLWSLLGLYVAYLSLVELSAGERGLAAFGVLALGLTETFWMHSVIAEVYSFSFLLVSLLIWLSLRLQKQWQLKTWLLLVFVAGLAVFHHRILVLLLPPLAFIWGGQSWYALRRQPRWIVVSGLAFLAPLLFYLYLPLRAWQGAAWVYGQPETWAGFWLQFTGGEVTGNLLRPPADVQAWKANLQLLAASLQAQTPWVGLLLGGLGLLWFTRHHIGVGMGLWGAAAASPIFIVLFPKAVWIPAVLMPTLLILMAGIVLLGQQLSYYAAALRWVGYGVLLAAAFWLYRHNEPVVTAYVDDPAGRAMIELLKPLPAEGAEVVALPWGQGYFAAAYGQLVTRELAPFPLVDHRANFRELLTTYDEIWTPASYLNYWPLSWWMDRLHQETLYAHGVIPGVVAIQPQPRLAEEGDPLVHTFENQMGVSAAALTWHETNTLHLQITWQALADITQDYQVAAHLLAQAPPTGPQDILAQADAVHPVAGWYPTSQWQTNEQVADAYLFTVPPGSNPVAVWITFYNVDATGNFVNQPWFMLPVALQETP